MVPAATARLTFAWPGLALAVLSLTLVGCVERRLTVRSEPTNALVVLDGQEVGHTPVSVPFTYYGDREIKLVKDGYETLTVKQKISTPWYQYLGLDFVSEVLWPCRIRDQRNYVYNMRPSVMVSTNDLLQRANVVRAEGQNPPPRALERAGLSPDPTNPASNQELIATPAATGAQMVPGGTLQVDPAYETSAQPRPGIFRRLFNRDNQTATVPSRQSFNPIAERSAN